MKSRTSFFNGYALRKNLTRFAPLWALYSVAEVLCLMTIQLSDPAILAGDLVYVMGPVSIAHMGYAFLVAACLFGDLFDTRLCNGLHAMPLRREGWLLTHLASGLLFALIPAVVGGGFACVLLGEFYWMALLWQAVSLLQFVFFFGLAVFSAMCAGKRLGMAAIYAALNFLSMLVYWIADVIYAPLLPGVIFSGDWFRIFSPVATFVNSKYVAFHYDKIQGGIFGGFLSSAWNYLYVCVGIGVLFLLLAWLLYRKRDLETAGDFISFQPMRMFFLIVYSFAAGILVYSFHYIFGTAIQSYTFLAVGIIAGWFTGWMLLERTVKIFTKKVLLGFAAFGILFAGSLGITYLDPVGITTYIPEADEVQAACLYTMGDSIRYESKYETGGRVLTDAAGIAEIQNLHRQMMDTPRQEGREAVGITVRYELESGISVYREYDVPAGTETADNLSSYLSNVHSVFMTNDWEAVKANTDSIVIYAHDDGTEPVVIDDQETILALLEAVAADCAAGTLAQHDYLHPGEDYVVSMDVQWMWVASDGNSSITRGDYVVVYEDCENLKEILRQMDIIS